MPPSNRDYSQDPQEHYGHQGYYPSPHNPYGYPPLAPPKKIIAHMGRENSHYIGGGLDALKLVNSPEGKRQGLGYRQAEYEVDNVRKGHPDMERSIFGQNPYTGDSAQTQPPPPTYNEDQMKWAQKFNGPAMNAPNPSLGGVMGGAIGGPAGAIGGMLPSIAQSAASPPRAPNMSRSALIKGAQDSGDFEKVRENYNASHARAGTGLEMDKNGTIGTLSKTDDGTGTSPYARATLGAGAQDIAARRDFERGEAPVMRTGASGQVLPSNAPQTQGMASKLNPYGPATTTFGAPQIGGAMMPNPLRRGEIIPMKQWAEDQSDVQDTKNGPNAAQAGADYLNPEALAKSMTPAAIPAAKKSAIASVPAAKKSAIASVPNPHLPQSGWGVVTGLANRLIPNAVNTATSAVNQAWDKVGHLPRTFTAINEPGQFILDMPNNASNLARYSSPLMGPSIYQPSKQPVSDVNAPSSPIDWKSTEAAMRGTQAAMRGEKMPAITKKPLGAASAKRFQSIARGGAI